MRKHDQDRIERAERRVANLAAYRRGLRSTPGKHYPTGLDERIEQAQRALAELKAELGALL